jgi:hypothetical protein
VDRGPARRPDAGRLRRGRHRRPGGASPLTRASRDPLRDLGLPIGALTPTGVQDRGERPAGHTGPVRRACAGIAAACAVFAAVAIGIATAATGTVYGYVSEAGAPGAPLRGLYRAGVYGVAIALAFFAAAMTALVREEDRRGVPVRSTAPGAPTAGRGSAAGRPAPPPWRWRSPWRPRSRRPRGGCRARRAARCRRSRARARATSCTRWPASAGSGSRRARCCCSPPVRPVPAGRECGAAGAADTAEHRHPAPRGRATPYGPPAG